MLANKLKSWLLYVLVVPPLVGCGLTEKNRRSGDEFVEPMISIEKPRAYDLHDIGCQDQGDLRNPITRSNVWGWVGGQKLGGFQAFEHTRSAPYLHSPIISSTIFSRKFERACESAVPGTGFQCTDREGLTAAFQSQEETKFLNICHDNFEYPRESIEGVALTSMYYLNKAASMYALAYGVPLSKIRLDVMPEFITTYDNYPGKDGKVQTWITNNLAYFPDNHLIGVFPETEEHSQKLYESGFVHSHELGHHIEYVLIGKKLKQIGIHWSPMKHMYEDLKANGVFQTSASGSARAKMWNSFSEGFADMKANLTEDRNGQAIGNIKCVGENRTVESHFFIDKKTEKVLTKSILKEFLYSNRATQYCGDINYTDPHIVGAIIAHVINKIVSRVVLFHVDSDQIHNFKADPLQSYRMIDQWLVNLADADLAGMGQGESLANLLTPLTVAIEKVVNNYYLSLSAADKQKFDDKTVKADICEIAWSSLPALDSKPFANSCPTR